MLRSIHSAATISSLSGVDRCNSLKAILRLALALIAGYAVMWPTASLAQNSTNVQHTENQVDQSLRGSVRVDPSTLGMSFSIPLASYPGRAGHGLPVVLNYSSKVLRLDFRGVDSPPISGPVTWTGVEFAEHSTAGWTSTLGAPSVEFTGMRQFYNYQGKGACEDVCVPGQDNTGDHYIKRIHVHMPDGSSHELRLDDHTYTLPVTAFTGTFYAVDGTRMRFESKAGASELYLPDGSRYLFPAYDFGNDLIATQYVDRNGNTLSYDANRQWTDTLGRVFTNPLPENPAANTPTEFRAKLVGGTEAVYTLHWKSLGNVLTPDPATSEPPPLRYPGNFKCNFNSYQNVAPYLFTSSGSYSKVCVEKDQNGNPILFNPVVLAEVVLPTGNSYRFTYNIYGEIDKIYLPSGGTESFVYSQVSVLSHSALPYKQTNRGVTERRVSAKGDGTDDSVWTYSVISADPHTVRSTGPDTHYTERLIHKSRYDGTSENFSQFGFDDARMGMVYEERAFKFPNVMLRRTLSKWVEAGPTSGGYSDAARDPKVTKRVEILLDTGGSDALAATTEMIYDADLNVTSTKRYGYKAINQTTAQFGDISLIDSGTLLRTAETDYLTDDPNYRARNLLALPTATRLKDGDDNIVAQSAISYDEVYDEVAHPLPPYSSVTQWTDPGTSARGNATTTSRWLNFDGSTFSTFPAGTYLLTHAQYDQCGSVRKVWDARDPGLTNPTLVEYASTSKFAYPTINTSADPDGSGELSALSSYAEYDFWTGLVTKTTDVNGQITTFAYNDPLNRIKQVIRATGDALVKNQTSYAYDDSAHTVTVTSDLNTYADNLLKTLTIHDGLGRDTETRKYESGTNYIAMRRQYDTSGRVVKTSNPFRPLAPENETPVWTIAAFDALSRVLTVTTPDNAFVSSSYSGNRVLITDQSEKQRLSVSDALGRLTDIWEVTATDSATEEIVSFPGHPEVTAGYRTSYAYDPLDGLASVTQRIGTAGTTQTRSFAFDSLKRLTSATNPESGTISYRYDNNGNLTQKTDAREPAVTTTYIYDQLNRVTNRSYSDLVTPAVIYAYDGGTKGKGRLTSVSSSVSSYSYGYDSLGRVLVGTQTTDGPDYTISYGYDRAGNMKTQTYPSGRVVATEFDNTGRIAGVKNYESGLYYAGGSSVSTDPYYANRVRYTAHAAMSQVRRGNGLWEHTTFNSRMQPTEIGLGTSGADSSKLKLDYKYGVVISGLLDITKNNGNLESQIITAPGLTLTQSYLYDGLNRLKSAKEMNGTAQIWKQTFNHDRWGNRTIDQNQTEGVQETVFEVEPATNRLLAPGDSILTGPDIGQRKMRYDPAGNLVNDSWTSYGSSTPGVSTRIYDAENRMLAAQDSTGGTTSYFYDGDGNRVKKVSGSQTTIFVYNVGGQVIAEYTNTGPSEVGGTSYLTADHLGTPRVISKADGTVKSRHDYLPFGEELYEALGTRTLPQGYASDNLRQKFTQKERDNETGLDYFGARYYGSTMGRFTSPDEPLVGQDEPDPQTWNLYSYTSNNPLIRVDEDGQRWFYRKAKDGWEVQWVNPNEDGSYTSPGEGWKEHVPSRENGFSLIFYSADGYKAYYFGEKADGSPTAKSLWTGKVESRPDHILAAAFSIQSILNVARASFTAWQAAGLAAREEIRTVATQGGTTAVQQQVVKATAGKITGFTKHGINQAISRDGVGVATRAMADAVQNPIKVVAGKASTKYIGRDATVVLNKAGKVITTWARNSAGRRGQ